MPFPTNSDLTPVDIMSAATLPDAPQDHLFGIPILARGEVRTEKGLLVAMATGTFKLQARASSIPSTTQMAHP